MARYARIALPQLHAGGTEVARARVFDGADFADAFEDFDPRLPTVEIELLETRKQVRCAGHGTGAVELIRQRWLHSQVVAVSLDADGFWRTTGMTEHPRSDGTIAFPLFAAPPLNPV